MARKIVKRCKTCKYCAGDHSYFYCSSKLSSDFLQPIYPETDNCEVWKYGTKKLQYDPDYEEKKKNGKQGRSKGTNKNTGRKQTKLETSGQRFC